MNGGTTRASMWLMSHTTYFKPEHMPYINDQISRLNDDQANALLALNLKNPTIILIISIFLGELGIDRFMLGDTGMGVGKLLTLGGCLVWWFIDLFMVQDRAREKNYEMLMHVLNYAATGYVQP
jgi:TM2 domain-containing membrane protein YozV